MGRPFPDDGQLFLKIRIVDPAVEAAPLERVVQLPGAVGGEHDDRRPPRTERAHLGDAHRQLTEELVQQRLELVVGSVDLVDEQHVGEDRAVPELKGVALRVEDHHAGDVRGEQVRRELDPSEGRDRVLRLVVDDRLAERLRQGCLAGAAGANDGHPVAPADLEVDARQDVQAALALAKAFRERVALENDGRLAGRCPGKVAAGDLEFRVEAAGPGEVGELVQSFDAMVARLAEQAKALLAERGIELLQVPEEEYPTMGPNVLALAPRKCLMIEGNPVTRKRLEAAGCEVLTYRGEELSLKAEGGATCLTRPILRSSSAT